MKVTNTTVFDILSRLRIYFQGKNPFRNIDTEEPFRSELYSSDQMDRHGKVLARSHKLMLQKSPDQLLKRLDNNEKTLLEVRNLLVESIETGKTVTPAAEWLLDNFYLIEEQVLIARKHLPKGYSEGLPYLATGTSSGLPRVYDIALEIISHSDGRVDIRGLSSFITAYQTHTVLTIGELWAIPIMLRLAVIENLRRISEQIAVDMIDKNLADYWAGRMTKTVAEKPADLVLTIADMARSKPVLGSPFVAAFIRNLQGKGPDLALALGWMEQQLTAMGVSSNDLIRQENQKQAVNQVSVRNNIGTLRLIGTTDWRVFVETLSSVEQVLRMDITGTYPLMDFLTRDRYRHMVEALSIASQLSETEVAQQVLRLTEDHRNNKQSFNRMGHVGYFLIDKGLKQTEEIIGARYSLAQEINRMAGRMPVFLYMRSIIFLSLIFAVVLYSPAYLYSWHSWLLRSFVGLLSLSGGAQLAISLINWLCTIWVKPKLLPRMDFSKGIPPEYRTLVVIPTMLSGRAYIESLVEALEIRFLANKEENLHFGLLTDFVDADVEVMPEDQELLAFTSKRIEALNQKYKQPGQDIFFLFHRPRTWNSREHKWMGYERKRGKLAALNAFIRGRNQNEFCLVTGNSAILNRVKYVITLDSDTKMPRETAWKLIATMAHPLNHAVFNQQKKRVTEGYGILQPRVAPAIPKKAPSLYLRMHGNTTGIDPYTRVSSDVYQDVFGEGSFIGKGIYDVDIFEQTLSRAFPENRILSHDLLEGCYVRSGLLSDVILFEESPARYEAEIKRHHRWIRGDWQIGAWILPFITGMDGKLTANRLSTLSRWKIFDNLRRSLLPISLLSLLLMDWFLMPLPWFWTISVTIILLLPSMLAVAWQLIHKPVDLSFEAHLSEVAIAIRDILLRFAFGIALLPYEAYQYTDAIVRTNWRMIFTRKNLLEWAASDTISSNIKNNIWSVYKLLWIVPLLSIVCAGIFIYTGSVALFIIAPLLILWLLAPALTWLLGLPETEKEPELSEDQKSFLKKSARKTWSYFEQFVNAVEHWLPPDNFQQQPAAVIAHRTSPTNMGLSLLANLAAYDFGFIGGSEMMHRCNDTMQSMCLLERYKGHFYNWYDTRSLLPLRPRYVSAVDSGNLTGHLLTLRQGILDIPGRPVFSNRIYQGIGTTASIIRDLLKKHSEPIEKILAFLKQAEQTPTSLYAVRKHLDELDSQISEASLKHTDHETILYKWTNRLSLQIKNIRKDLAQVLPWLELLPVPDGFIHLAQIDHIPSLLVIEGMHGRLLPYLEAYEQEQNSAEKKEWLARLRTLLIQGSSEAKKRLLLLKQLADHCERFSDVDYGFLFEPSTGLLRIGYNVDEQRKDESFYDLLASEARLGIFVGIALGKLPQESWFALGRLLTNSGKDLILLSWSGSMFEYLMPDLIMPTYKNTLLYQTNKACVKRQIEYAGKPGMPWGISESAYNMVDTNLNYQYRAFGVPGLGLKRGLKEDLVIAPYASMLALLVSPAKACSNLQLLSEQGFEGEFGFFEAIDYTPGRQPRGKTYSIVQSFMVHHQAMSLLSLDYLLLNKPMQQRFLSDLRFQATLLLLQESIPRTNLFYAHTEDLIETPAAILNEPTRVINTPNTTIPELQLLGNGRYQVMITNAGGGYSRWKDIAVTRWREDSTLDDRGIFCYIKDVNSGKFWSNTYQPTLHPAHNYETIFSQGHVEFRRQDYGIETKTEIVISPEDDTELRRLKIKNRTQSVKILDITSYAEIVLTSQASDEAHTAFSNLFVRTEILPEQKAILCTRRPRSMEETPPWMFHHMEVQDAAIERITYETDRMQFIGRGKTVAAPEAMEIDSLSGSQGPVLDPVMAIRYRIRLNPNQSATVELIYGIGESRESCESLMHKYRDRHLKNRAFELSWTHTQVLLRQINASGSDAQLYDQLAAYVIYANPALRAEPSVINNNFRGQSGLWSHSVSGDLPIVLLHLYNAESIQLVKQMVQAHTYWRLKGLEVDLIIWNEDYGTYRQLLQDQLLALTATEAAGIPGTKKPGHIFVKSASQLSPEDRILFESISRAIIYDNKGSLSDQVNRQYPVRVLPPPLIGKAISEWETPYSIQIPEDLVFFNGIGGFTPDGKEYKIVTDKKNITPAPWVNVIANPDFGTVISESGSAYTWAINAHEYRISPWSNDPVSDQGGEAYYIRDEETGHFWSPSAFPAGGSTAYMITHGFGYTSFDHIEQGIISEMCVFVDKSLPIKFIVLKIKNHSGTPRKLSVTGYLEILMGDLRSNTNMHILSEQDPATGALLMRNRYNIPFSNRITFFKAEGTALNFTTDRTEFIGRNRRLADPQALHRQRLSGRAGAAMDPCAALQVKFDLPDRGEKEIIFQVGNAENIQTAHELIRQFTDKDAVAQSLHDVKEYWNEIISRVQITTPEKSLDLLANGWLTYQTMASRIFARSGFYQSGGAFGFRDQLQDVLSLLHATPQLAREQILLCASRQFREGDVQHWWHPPTGRGVRTRCSDDYLWLPFVTAVYILHTGDSNILTEPLYFLEARLLNEGEDSYYDLPLQSVDTASLYDHCVLAIRHGFRYGKHGLPLIGTGDWNDGFDKVGNEGKGESVWMAFFLYDILIRFGKIASLHKDPAFAAECKKAAQRLKENIDKHAWDGQWYKRAWFDNGSPLGSSVNEECSIDSIAQSWSVLSGAGTDQRMQSAMESAYKILVKKEIRIIQLLDPAFDKSTLNPGYIKGYVPGIRENGGQYTHAAIWLIMAFAKLGDKQRVWELLDMINPINHDRSLSEIAIYKAEPYVLAADVYANKQHAGRGGWTWYTGSAGWMYRLITESLLGLLREGNKLFIEPCIPRKWESYKIQYRFQNIIYHIEVVQINNIKETLVEVDGIIQEDKIISLLDDGQDHQVKIILADSKVSYPD